MVVWFSLAGAGGGAWLDLCEWNLNLQRKESSREGAQPRAGSEKWDFSAPRFKSNEVNRNQMAFLPSGSQPGACVHSIGEFYYQVTG